ncbi:hypothetical protein [Facklamia miroungae]|uniref:Alpha-ribazole kinase n=1 Tax=Facklamia miroungae TaxID=120956 RepID=A0A1G7R0J4_9LACT|nr:hypothetical protein [Facklamia miroungae]NKZ29134.1 hypothetical protein [Facklamia miroungae]SDG04265.1 hypothetical protein SAMN05421791_102293 [Facklamia miroungae]
MEKYRDLHLMPVNFEESLIIACDSSASIGEKEADALKVSPEIVASLAVRVVLMEVLSLNAQPQLLINLFGNEMEPTGSLMLKGIKKELALAGFPKLSLNGSTEENMPTKMTSFGLTLIAKAKQSELKIKQARAGDQIYQVGKPLMGQELLNHFDQIITYQDLYYLLSLGDVISEIVPIGSKGALNEALQIASFNQLKLRADQDQDQFYQSAGPATSLLISVKPGLKNQLLSSFTNIQWVGELY